MVVLAHGIGGRSDLPIPFYLALYGAGIAVALSFALLGLLWPKPRLRGDEAGTPLPRLERLVDSPTFRGVLRGLALFLSGVVVAAALAGPPQTVANIAPWALYSVFWVGIVVVSLLFGPVWQVVNPLRTVHAALSRVAGKAPEEGMRPLPDRLGYWPAAAWLAVFVWLELVYPERAEPGVVAVFLVAYATLNLVAAAVYGSGWFERGDGFEVYSTFVGRLAPLGRRSDGRLVRRSPLDGLAGLGAQPGIVGLIAVLLGSTAFDGLTRTDLWTRNVDPSSVPAGTLGLAGAILFVVATYTLATRLAARPARADAAPMPGEFAHSVVPIAVGYAIAHYISLLLFEGQQVLVLASDPFGTGANLFGTSLWSINYGLVPASAISLIQVGAVVLGHVVGVIAAHDRAVRLFRGRAAVRGQYPLLAVMVGYTVGGVALLLGA